ncbi:NACHT domain-containing protein [Cryptosporangium minutisporangium]|uniref:NACHT N-terminal Helical domain-containing protein n=1 Tax=Cryptosporangium minutisporangium TaxID=113569 RepID=A0ABP6SVS1_9ACTN
MRVDPALTYRGALSILGRFDRPLFDRFESLLSSTMLGAGFLDLVDPKNDGVRLLRGFADGVHTRLLGTSGHDRLQLIAAAHTTLVVSSFFEALQAHLGGRYRNLKFTDAEKVGVATGEWAGGRPRLDALWHAPVPIPGPRYGFRENLESRLEPYFIRMARDGAAFLNGLATDLELTNEDQARVAWAAVRTYESAFVRMAADVPEFGIWTMLGESTETRRELRVWGGDLLEAANRAANRLDAIERLLGELVPPAPTQSGLDVLGRLNRSILGRPVLGDPTLSADQRATLPTLEQSYITPRLRVAVADRSARPSDERWWAEQAVVADTELFLAGYLCSPESVDAPLLVLGLPGAGKSMLTQMLAARLPVSGWTAVRVPLRRVRADASVPMQIQAALDGEAHGRLQWPQVVEDADAAGTTRVVVLDGLDELMQASGASQSRYLYEVAEFQEREAAIGRPVAAVVTSRTVMADRVQIPPGTLIARLEGFDDDQIAQWMAMWNELNAGRPDFRALTVLPPALLELARQPLLLLLIALYTADPRAPELAEGVTTATLYEQLITHFLRREALKDAAVPSGRGADVDRLAAERRLPLRLAAFAMVNRGRPFATGPELERDLRAFLGAVPSREHDLQEPLDHTIRTVGRFFFVHASGERPGTSHELPATYEFLHSTFGEYLVAEHVAGWLRLLTRQRADALRFGPGYAEPPDSNQLRALLSHEPLAKFPRVLEMVGELSTGSAVASLLQELITGARNQLSPWTPAAYNPSDRDVIDHLAVYTVNVVLLLMQVESRVPVSSLAPVGGDAVQWWRSLVRQWRSCLDDEAWLLTVGALTTVWDDDELVLVRMSSRDHLGTRPAGWTMRGEARLLGDLRVDAQLSSGAAAWRGTIADDPEVAAIFAGLVEMQLHGVVHIRTLRAAIELLSDPGRRVPPVVFDLLLTIVVRVSVWLAAHPPGSALIDRGLVLTLVMHREQRRYAFGPSGMWPDSEPEPDWDEFDEQQSEGIDEELGAESLAPRPHDELKKFGYPIWVHADALGHTDPARVSLWLEESGPSGTRGQDSEKAPTFYLGVEPIDDLYRRGDAQPSVDAAVADLALAVEHPGLEDLEDWNSVMFDMLTAVRQYVPGGGRS